MFGTSIERLSFAECIGAYLTDGALIAVQAATGVGKRAMDLIPIPLFMATVAAMFLLWHRLLRPGPDVRSSQGRPRSGRAEAGPPEAARGALMLPTLLAAEQKAGAPRNASPQWAPDRGSRVGRYLTIPQNCSRSSASALRLSSVAGT